MGTADFPPGAAATTASREGPLQPAIVRVFVLVRVRLYREGIAAALAADDRFCVVGADGDRAVRAPAARELAPDVVLVEAGARGRACVRARDPRRGARAARVVALGIAEEEADVLPLAEAGIAGWVDAGRIGGRPARGGRSGRGGRGALLSTDDREPAAPAGVARRRISRDGLDTPTLTRRQREIVALIDEGLSNKEIARRLSIELPTVKNHVHNILEKLQVSRRGAAAAVVRSPLSR